MINFGSSIGLEAVIMGKVVVNPKFLHENHTVFDGEPGLETTHSIKETTELLSGLLMSPIQRRERSESQALVDQEIFANTPEMDPIARYRRLIP